MQTSSKGIEDVVAVLDVHSVGVEAHVCSGRLTREGG
jgi:hypothetical protein